MALRRSLPESLPGLLRDGKVEEIKVALGRCEVGARLGDYFRSSALHFPECPEAVVRWLVQRGEDVDATDRFGARPLHRLRFDHDRDRARLLLELGADVDATDGDGATPLMVAVKQLSEQLVDTYLEAGARPDAVARLWNGEYSTITYALASAETSRATEMLRIVERLLKLGATPTGAEKASLAIMRKEAQRSSAYHRRQRDDAPAPAWLPALNRLCEICGVETVALAGKHDGVSPIVVPSERPFSALWNLLVPDEGPAPTAQGEAVRIAGYIEDELLIRRSQAWDGASRVLVDGLGDILASGTRLPAADLSDVHAKLARIRTGRADEDAVNRVIGLVIAWITLNPTPRPNPLPDVGR